MTSKTSCFDSAIFKRSLRKTLPLWACYFLFWLFILPGDLISFNYQPEYYDSLTGRLCERILTFCTVGTLLSALIGRGSSARIPPIFTPVCPCGARRFS